MFDILGTEWFKVPMSFFMMVVMESRKCKFCKARLAIVAERGQEGFIANRIRVMHYYQEILGKVRTV